MDFNNNFLKSTPELVLSKNRQENVPMYKIYFLFVTNLHNISTFVGYFLLTQYDTLHKFHHILDIHNDLFHNVPYIFRFFSYLENFCYGTRNIMNFKILINDFYCNENTVYEYVINFLKNELPEK